MSDKQKAFKYLSICMRCREGGDNKHAKDASVATQGRLMTPKPQSPLPESSLILQELSTLTTVAAIMGKSASPGSCVSTGLNHSLLFRLGEITDHAH
jgi:hypothetical protein